MRFIRRALSNIFLVLVGAVPVFSQKVEMESGFYDFINYQKNKLTIEHDSALSHFYSKLDNLAKDQKTKVNIVHIGDSHIQADFFSNKIRELFHTEPYFGNGGRGFLFPFDLAKTNNPPFYGCKYKGSWEGSRNSISHDHGPWGVSGVLAMTKDSTAKFTVTLNTWKDALQKYDANYVRVYYPVNDSSSYEVRLRINDTLVAPDSIVQDGYAEFLLDSLHEVIDFALTKTDSTQNQFTLQGLFFGNEQPGIVYHSIGVNGAKVDSYLRCSELTQHLKTLKPDLVIVSLGTNDAYNYTFYPDHYKSVYRQMIANIKAAAPNSSLLLTAPGDGMRRRWKTNTNNEKAAKCVLELADEFECAAWNFYEVMGGLNSINKWVGYGLGKRDFLHLTSQGYALQGKMLYDALILEEYFGKSQKIFVE